MFKRKRSAENNPAFTQGAAQPAAAVTPAHSRRQARADAELAARLNEMTRQISAAAPPADDDFDALIAIARQGKLLRDERDRGHLAWDNEHARLVLPILSSEFSSFLTQQFYQFHQRQPRPRSLAAAIGVLNGQARFLPDTTFMHLRRASDGAAFWLDLARSEGEAVRIDENGWEVIAHPPVYFLRNRLQNPLPIPEVFYDIHALQALLGIPGKDEAVLVLAWLLAAYIPNMPVPMLALLGPQGSGKTTLARILRNLIDPHQAELLAMPNEKDLALALEHQAVLVLDNLSQLSQQQSNRLCRAVTGFGYLKTRPRHAGEAEVIGFRRPIIVTALDLPSHAPDWLDRTVAIRLEARPPEMCAQEMRVMNKFRAQQGKFLGLVLDLLSRALAAQRKLPQMYNFPRMADYAGIGMALMSVFRQPPERFLQVLAANAGQLSQDLLNQDPVALALQTFMSDKTDWTGSPTDLARQLSQFMSGKVIASSLSKRLRLLQINFSQFGMHVSFSRGHQGCLIAVKRVDSVKNDHNIVS